MKSTNTGSSILLFLIILLVISACHRKTVNTSYTFPDDWLGHWEGELNIYNQNKIKMTIPMELINEATDIPNRFRWALAYGAGEERQLRDYYLDVINKEIGHYKVDEQNSIFLDGYVMHNRYTSVFSVMGNILTSTYSIHGDKMIFEIMVHPETPLNTSGGKVIEGDSIPEVKSFEVTNFQRAILKRKTSLQK